jgi:hypothetical protein
MTSINSKAAQQWDAGGLRNSDRLGSEISFEDTQTRTELQVFHLTRRCRISAALAVIVAPIVFGEGER